jgi:hypothetical protein
MLVYVADKKQFLHDCDYEDIEEVIQNRFKEATFIQPTKKRLITSGPCL